MDERFVERWNYAIMTEYITLKGILDEDFVNYRVPSMTIMFPRCSFKCEINGSNFCHNAPLIHEPDIQIPISNIYRRYITNPISEAIVCQGLEPFDSWEELDSLLFHFRIHEACFDPFVIYTGYTEEEIEDKIDHIRRMYDNVIVKFGRYIPGQESHYDEILGVNLASPNQFAKRIEIRNE